MENSNKLKIKRETLESDWDLSPLCPPLDLPLSLSNNFLEIDSEIFVVIMRAACGRQPMRPLYSRILFFVVFIANFFRSEFEIIRTIILQFFFTSQKKLL